MVSELRKRIIQVFNDSHGDLLTITQIAGKLSNVSRRSIEKEIHELYFDGVIEPGYKIGKVWLWYLHDKL